VPFLRLSSPNTITGTSTLVISVQAGEFLGKVVCGSADVQDTTINIASGVRAATKRRIVVYPKVTEIAGGLRHRFILTLGYAWRWSKARRGNSLNKVKSQNKLSIEVSAFTLFSAPRLPKGLDLP
jgi:hypothetical protein